VTGPDGDRRESPAVRRWCESLVRQMGLSPAQCDERAAVLLRLCGRLGRSPDELLADAARDLDAVVAPGRDGRADLVLQSFLVHNGINVHGRVVCIPHTLSDLADQGARWTGGSVQGEH